MDSTGPLGVLLLPLLLMGTALGNGAQKAPGSPSAPSVGNNAEICLLPPDVGPCRARIPSYYYDRYTQSCRIFFYGGCEGNANNFDTLEDCNEACSRIEKVPKICRLEVSEGQCGVRTGEYFFNLSSMTCEKFVSGGCHNNKNRFPDKDTCMGFCAPKRRPSYCYSPKDEGLCSANVTRYYFNPRHTACETFTYTGCGGNDNNFLNMEDCTRVCVKGSRKEKNMKLLKTVFPGRRLKTYKK
ncbi:tissue factor pathway inhibitor 2 isoform X1 [Ursus americanus]|uniref:Tissue factor pathway inhibitor n=2 Tax=Ursus TaxID=9639 RepID=A0A384BPF1_URSMA|nr:tissue factor pathway inhibitor 2 isoform X1 [Ursus maritimus]XP_026361574.1 tissue factor pathway inhibitor 2 isoform X1 [Ursus arctos]XP_045649195.1 tissue factor pathway inhibitor 2 isoform X1 [Ursus americanus]XP_057160436.1 tissue factor pathway inhibitor 2 isoform X1 [Ursus arctos]